MPWLFDHDTLPSNRFPTAVLSHRRVTVSRLCFAASRASETFFDNSSLWTFSPCCSITFLPNVVLALTEKSKFEVCPAQPSHSGAECDPLHRGAVFCMGKQPPQRSTDHWNITGRHRHPHRINRHTGRRAKKRFLKNPSDSELLISDFSIQFSFHFFQSCAVFPCSLCYCRDSVIDRTQG